MSPSSRHRVVALEWDRGHEITDAIVRAESDTGVVVSVVVDLTTTPGLSWIRRDEITDLVDLDAELAVSRLAELRGEVHGSVDVGLTAIGPLLVHLAATEPLIGIYRERTGSDELLVGKLLRSTTDTAVLELVDSNGRYEDAAPFEYRIAEIIRVDWATTYLTALWELLAAGD